jgi:hypothetical protein
MQCDEVIRELATPSDHRDTAAVTEHLAVCPSCANWSQRALQLDRLWEETRPAEPSLEVWDGVWACIATSIDSSTSTELESSHITRTAPMSGSPPVVGIPLKTSRHSPRPRRWRLAMIGLAQAAAVLVTAGLLWRQFSPSHTGQITEDADLTSSPRNSESVVRVTIPEEGLPVVVDEGHLVVIHEGRQELKVAVPIFLADLSMLVVHADGQVPRVVDRTPRKVVAREQWWKPAPQVKGQIPEGGVSWGVDDWYVMYNAVESMASPPVVAME